MSSNPDARSGENRFPVSQNPLDRAELPLSFHIFICKTPESPPLYLSISSKDVPCLSSYLSDNPLAVLPIMETIRSQKLLSVEQIISLVFPSTFFFIISSVILFTVTGYPLRSYSIIRCINSQHTLFVRIKIYRYIIIINYFLSIFLLQRIYF